MTGIVVSVAVLFVGVILMLLIAMRS